MEKELFTLSAENGIWAALFVALFLYVLYDSRNREKEYREVIHENQEIIKTLSDTLCSVDDIRDDVSFIKHEIKRK